MRKKLTFLFATFVIAGCAVPQKTRAPSEYLLATDINVDTLLVKIQERLGYYKYKTKKLDLSAGILIFEPRKFNFNKNTQRVEAEQIIHFRQEGGSLKLRIQYDCDYRGGGELVPCLKGDKEAQNKMKRIEKSLLEAIRPLLQKHAETELNIESKDE